MFTCFNGVTQRPQYEIPGNLGVIRIKNSSIVINPSTGGWAALSEDEIINLFSPYRNVGGELFDDSYNAGLIKRNGSFIFESNKLSHSPGKLYFFEFDLSSTCNLNCIYCSNNTNSGIVKELDLDIGILWIDKIYEYAVSSELPEVILEFTGGEPLINIDFINQICCYAFDKFKALKIVPEIHFATNLTVLGHKQIDFMKKFKPFVQVSLDGPKEIHDEHRSFYSGKGSYDTIVKNLDILKKEDIKIETISSVITSKSVNYMPEIAQFILDLGYTRMTLQPMHCIGRASNDLNLACNSDIYVNKLFETMSNVILPFWIRTKHQVYIRHLGILFAYLLEPWRSYMCQRCPCGNSSSIISTDAKGDVYGCNQAPFNEDTVLGNIRQVNFLQCMESANAKKILDRQIENIKECRTCIFRSYCQGGCPKTALTVHGTIEKPGDICDLNRKLFAKGIEKLVEDAYPMDLIRVLADTFLKN